MKTTMSERGLSPLGFLGALILIGVMVIFTIIFIHRGIGRGTSDIEERFDNFADFDGDRVANLYDQCPCTDYGITEHSQLRGCPSGTTAEQSQDNKRHFREKTCDQLIPVSETSGGNSLISEIKLQVIHPNGEATVTPSSPSVDMITTKAESIGYLYTCGDSNICDLRIEFTSDMGASSNTFVAENQGATHSLRLDNTGLYRFQLSYGAATDLGIDIMKD